MKQTTKIQVPRKAYDKPTWQKQEIFERFTLACGGNVKMSPTPVNCTVIGS